LAHDTRSGVRIGVPRSLYYFQSYPYWRRLMGELGFTVVLSPATNESILGAGLAVAVDDTCLPVKAFYGHCLYLADHADFLLVPRIVSLQRGTYICPKYMGLPDMVRASLEGRIPDLLTPLVDAHRRGSWADDIASSLAPACGGVPLGHLRQIIRQAGPCNTRGISFLSTRLRDRLRSGRTAGGPQRPAERMRFGLLGHPYLLADDGLNGGLVEHLVRLNVAPVTPADLSPDVVQRQLDRLPKKVFWSEGAMILGAALHFLQAENEVDGMIHAYAFGCGSDSLLGEEIQRRARRSGRLPLLSLSLDEHAGQAGLLTRLEAFCDMVDRRRRTAG